MTTNRDYFRDEAARLDEQAAALSAEPIDPDYLEGRATVVAELRDVAATYRSIAVMPDAWLDERRVLVA